MFWGPVLVLLGGIPLLVRAGALDGAAFAEVWRLWPVILIGVGLAIMQGRRRAGLAVTVILALAFGVAGGGVLASGNLWLGNLGDCVATQAPMQRMTQAGTLEAPSSVRLELDCGDVNVKTGATSAWSLTAQHLGAPPIVTATASILRVAAPNLTGSRRQEWTLELPAASVRDVAITANAAAATFDVESMTLDRFRANVNAGDLRLDAGKARIGRLEVGAAMLASLGRMEVRQGGACGLIAGDVTVGRGGIVGLAITPRLEVADGGRVLAGPPLALGAIAGVATGVILGWLIGRTRR